jgi:hypothetical protein
MRKLTTLLTPLLLTWAGASTRAVSVETFRAALATTSS